MDTVTSLESRLNAMEVKHGALTLAQAKAGLEKAQTHIDAVKEVVNGNIFVSPEECGIYDDWKNHVHLLEMKELPKAAATAM